MLSGEILASVKELSKINSFNKKVEYANQHFQRIGSGSGRIVYALDNDNVLKLAKNAKGVAQNEAEEQVARYKDYDDILTNVYESDDNNTWIISEKAKKITVKRFKELVGFDIYQIYYYLNNEYDLNKGKKEIWHINADIKEQLDNNEFVQRLFGLLMDYSLSPGDMGRLSTYGEVNRNGIASVVLVDYGLSDEVYDTYYSPQKKNPRAIYELYGCYDGNDDILSDADGGEDIRKGMWALMPYGVGDGNDVVNETVLSVVNDKSKYVDQPIESLPILVDVYYKCLNNLKNILNTIGNKKQFYENLIGLQEYLNSNGFETHSNLIKEEYTLNEKIDAPKVEVFTLDDAAYADELANAVAVKLNLGHPTRLGGGGHGFAYEINNEIVMKLTDDTAEADAAFKLMRQNPKYLARQFEVVKIYDTIKNMSFYAILQENIKNKPLGFFENIKNIINNIKPNYNDIDHDYYDIMTDMKIAKNFNYDNFLEIFKQILTKNPEANISDEDRKKAYDFMVGIINIRKELIDFGIKSADYVEPKNLGYDDKGVLKFFDMGGYRAPEPQLNDKDIVTLPENVEVNNTNPIIDKIVTHFNLNIGDKINDRTYYVDDDKILKITSDKNEANENLKLKGKDLKYIANVFKVFKIDSNDKEVEYYGIILEKLKTKPEQLKNFIDRLNYIFENILNTNFIEVVNYLVDDESNNINVNKIKKFFAKNHKDAHFFQSIINIVEECRLRGINNIKHLNPNNLGFKKDGRLGLYNVEFYEQDNPINEDGSSLFSTNNSIGQDNFPTYNQFDDSAPIDGNVETCNYEINEENVDVTQNPNFKAWFGNSKVVDKNGKPLVVYHGSRTNFNKFKITMDGGYHFGTKKQAEVRGSILTPVYLSIQNPLFTTDKRDGQKNTIANAKKEGYDGLIYNNIFEGKGVSFVAFYPNQIKSATGNKGTFNPSSSSIIDERLLSYVKGSSTVDVKKKCRLAGNGNTSTACNQGDINNLVIKPIDEAKNILDDESFKSWFSGSKVVDDKGNPLLVYHGTNKDFNRFSTKYGAQPIIWFSSDKNKIERGDSGAVGRSRIIPAYLSIKKMAGWPEYQKYGLGQLYEMGFDGAKLDDDYFVFNSKQIKTVKESKSINENTNNSKITIPFLMKKYYEWNNQGGGYSDPSETSVLKFLQNNYEDLSNDLTLRKQLLHALTDNEILSEIN